jgi:hypothetical protein
MPASPAAPPVPPFDRRFANSVPHSFGSIDSAR